MKTKEKQELYFWSVMISLFFGVFLGTFNISAVNVALPTFIKEFNTSLDSVKWILTGFMLATGTACPLTGYLGGKFSYKKLYLFAIIGFTVSSILCAFSFSISLLITFRIIQGMFSGLIIPSTMTILYQVIPRERQAFAASLWSMASMLAPAIAPTLSGWLIQNFNWRAIFIINVPVGIIAILMIFHYVPQDHPSTSHSFDFIGLTTVVTLSISLLIAFSEGSKWGWTSIMTLGLFVLGIISLILFIMTELKKKSPALDIRVFKYNKYTFSVIALSIVTISLYAGTLLTPLFLQNIQHLSALDSGLILLLPSLAMALMMPIVGTLYNKIDSRIIIAIGISLLALGSFKVANLNLNTPHSYIILWMTVRYIGISFSTMPITNTGMSIIPKNISGHASSVNNWIRQVSSALAIGIFSSLLITRTKYHESALAQINLPNNLIHAKAYTSGINDLFFISTIIALIALPLCLALKKTSKIEELNSKQAA
ncbi:DHA2 family efflux MFS transporter permease subunit [Inconstantimicrobium mannanitabidum]|nr:DHA2 family efflux MFS transporter permease subunit [Clostridium sp. TW13]